MGTSTHDDPDLFTQLTLISFGSFDPGLGPISPPFFLFYNIDLACTTFGILTCLIDLRSISGSFSCFGRCCPGSGLASLPLSLPPLGVLFSYLGSTAASYQNFSHSLCTSTVGLLSPCDFKLQSPPISLLSPCAISHQYTSSIAPPGPASICCALVSFRRVLRM